MLQNFTTQLVSKTQLTKDVFLFRFQLIEPKTIQFIAGQYLILKIGETRRLYSVSSSSLIHDYFDLLVEIVSGGIGSNYFNNLMVGERAEFQGPAGLFTLKNNQKDKIFLATGTGIAPIKSMILSHVILSVNEGSHRDSSPRLGGAQNDRKKVNYYLFWGLRTRNDLYFFDEFKALSQQYPRFQFKICLSREENMSDLDPNYFTKGRINQGLMLHVSSFKLHDLLNDFDYYVCGGRDMVTSMIEFLQAQGVLKENIYCEKF